MANPTNPMPRNEEAFQVGERVVYTGFSVPEYGQVVKISVEAPSDERNSLELRIYTIALDKGGVFTGLSRHLRRMT